MTSRLAAVALALVMACNGSGGPETTTPQVLVASELGAFLVEGDRVVEIVAGPVLVAMDDGQGGTVFQKGLGADTDWDSTIWWMPTGSTETEPLVLPEGAALYLNDVGEGPDGAEVWYTRAEGATIEDTVQYLVRHSLTTGETDDLGEVGGGESSVTISVGGNLVVGEWGADGFFRCGFHDRGLAAIDSAASPCQEESLDYGCQECPRHLVVSTDGGEVAWLEARSVDGVNPTTLVVRASASGSKIAEIPLPVDRGEVISVDFHQGWLLLNLVGPEGAWLPPLLVDPESDAGIVELSVIGNARVAKAEIELAAG